MLRLWLDLFYFSFAATLVQIQPKASTDWAKNRKGPDAAGANPVFSQNGILDSRLRRSFAVIVIFSFLPMPRTSVLARQKQGGSYLELALSHLW
jgi:hypothetical protein